jgi:hypothetical protein
MSALTARVAAFVTFIALAASTGLVAPDASAAQPAAARSARSAGRAGARRRATARTLTSRQQAFKQHLLQRFYWWGLPSPTPRVRLSRQGGSRERFTVSDGAHLLRGEVYEKLGGIGVMVHEAFERVDGRWVPAENPLDDKNRLAPSR